MWRSYLFCGLIGWIAAAMPAFAFVAYVSNEKSNTVSVIDTDKWIVTKTIKVGQRVWHLAFTPDEKYLLATNGVSNDVSVIDVAAQKVIKTIQVGELPWGITIAPQP